MMSKKNVPSDLTKTALFKERSPGFGVTDFCGGGPDSAFIIGMATHPFLKPTVSQFPQMQNRDENSSQC